jgi:hypothetical protein
MAFLDGEAPVQERAAIEAHVVACAECRQVISDLGTVNRTMAAWQPENAPATLRLPRVVRRHASVFPRIPRSFSWRPGYRVIAFGGVAATVLLVVSLSTSLRRTPAAFAVADKTSMTDGAVDNRLDQNEPVDRIIRRLPAGGGGGRPEPAKGIQEAQSRVAGQAAKVAPETVAPRQPSVIRTATLRLVASDFNAARASVESIVGEAAGFLDQITVNGAPGSARTLTGSLRVPSARLNEALTRLRQLGQVTEDTQGSEDVTDQIVDLDARRTNARATEQRLNDILKSRTGKLSDILQVEREISRVRLEIEQMDAQRVNTGRRVSYATITLEIDEIRKAGLESGPLSFSTRLRVATADGLEAAVESVVSALLFVLRAGPATLMWLAAGLPIWILARRIRRRVGRQTS